jgi:hypothetical protein
MATSPDAEASYSLDGGPPRVYNGRIALVPGRHQLTYWGTDMAGNEGARLCQALHLDIDDPVAALNVPGPYAMEGMQTWFDGSGSQDDMSGVATYRFIFGDGEESGWTSSPVAWHTYQRAGDYRASLTVRDAAGRESAQAGLTVTVKAPGISGPAPVPSAPSSGKTAAEVAVAAVLVLAVLSAAWALRRRGRPAAGKGPRRAVSQHGPVEWDEDSLKRPQGLPNRRRGGP